eukprot:scaffold149_cov179-Amphora_coffeaeformis.AAC.1
MAKSGKSENHGPISWTLEGRAILIHPEKRDEFVNYWLPLFFPKGKFESFTRKLYRWGFRQVTSDVRRPAEADKDRVLVFASPCFQKERRCLMAYMKSITARNSGRANPPSRKKAPQSDANQYQSHGAPSMISGIPVNGTAIQTDPSRVVIIPQGMPLAGALEQCSSNYSSAPKITIVPLGNAGIQHFFPLMMGALQYPPLPPGSRPDQEAAYSLAATKQYPPYPPLYQNQQQQPVAPYGYPPGPPAPGSQAYYEDGFYNYQI